MLTIEKTDKGLVVGVPGCQAFARMYATADVDNPPTLRRRVYHLEIKDVGDPLVEAAIGIYRCEMALGHLPIIDG